MNQQFHPAGNLRPLDQCDYACSGCDRPMPFATAYCPQCEDVMCGYLVTSDDPPLTPAQAELAAIYAGRAIAREQAASVIQSQAAVVNLCAGIIERARPV